MASKVRQLDLAVSIGLMIPETVITNNPKLVLEMFSTHERIIYKALNGFVFPDQTGILTTEITREHVGHRSPAVERAPGIYQELIEKDYELRVTVVGDKIFPALVRTPKTGDASVDWRHAHFEDIFESCTLDQQIGNKLLHFHREAGLKFGAYDLIVDRKGQIFFLECNPAGQFLWLENSLGLPITDAIACQLCDLASS